jgi:hypothetical protein
MDHEGLPTVDEHPQVSVEITSEGFDVIRTERTGVVARWAAPGSRGLRGMPTTAALDDGTVLVGWYDMLGRTYQLVRFKPDDAIERIAVSPDTHIGPNIRPGVDFGERSMGVIAELRPDGSATWWSMPDGWTVVASDIWGTVLAKQDGTQLQLAMAEFPAGACRWKVDYIGPDGAGGHNMDFVS